MQFSAYWITVPIGVLAFLFIVYLLITGRHRAQQKDPAKNDSEPPLNENQVVDDLEWVRPTIEEQAEHISHLVLVVRYETSGRLTGDSPYIDIEFVYRNGTVYTVSVTECAGYICFANNEFEEPPTMDGSHSQNIKFGLHGSVTLRQRLKPHEAVNILNQERAAFEFHTLTIAINVQPPIKNKWGLIIPEVLNEKLLAANPKLEINIAKCSLNWVADTRPMQLPQYFASMQLSVTNHRQTKIEIETIKLITTFSDAPCVLFAATDEFLFDKKEIDESGQLETRGNRAKNLNALSPLVFVQDQTIRGALEFAISDMPLDIPELAIDLGVGSAYTLVLTDKTGEIHTVKGIFSK